MANTAEHKQPPAGKDEPAQTDTKSRMIAILVLAAIISVPLGIGLANHHESNADNSPVVLSSSTSTQVAKVDVSGQDLTPATVYIKKGTSVVWTNKGSTSWQLNFSPPHPRGASPTIKPDQTYSATFRQPGIFSYTIDGTLGTVIVQ